MVNATSVVHTSVLARRDSKSSLQAVHLFRMHPPSSFISACSLSRLYRGSPLFSRRHLHLCHRHHLLHSFKIAGMSTFPEFPKTNTYLTQSRRRRENRKTRFFFLCGSARETHLSSMIKPCSDAARSRNLAIASSENFPGSTSEDSKGMPSNARRPSSVNRP